MHSLEQLLFLLSERIRRETGNDDLAKATLRLASASHDYESSQQPDPLAEMCQDWTHRSRGQGRSLGSENGGSAEDDMSLWERDMPKWKASEHAMQQLVELAGRELRHVAKLHGGGFASLQLVQWTKRHPRSALYECFDWSKSATDKERAAWFDAQWLDVPLDRTAQAMYSVFTQKVGLARTAPDFKELPEAQRERWRGIVNALFSAAGWSRTPENQRGSQ